MTNKVKEIHVEVEKTIKETVKIQLPFFFKIYPDQSVVYKILKDADSIIMSGTTFIQKRSRITDFGHYLGLNKCLIEALDSQRELRTQFEEQVDEILDAMDIRRF